MAAGRSSTACSTRAAGGPCTRRRSRCALLAACGKRCYVAWIVPSGASLGKLRQWPTSCRTLCGACSCVRLTVESLRAQVMACHISGSGGQQHTAVA